MCGRDLFRSLVPQVSSRRMALKTLAQRGTCEQPYRVQRRRERADLTGDPQKENVAVGPSQAKQKIGSVGGCGTVLALLWDVAGQVRVWHRTLTMAVFGTIVTTLPVCRLPAKGLNLTPMSPIVRRRRSRGIKSGAPPREGAAQQRHRMLHRSARSPRAQSAAPAQRSLRAIAACTARRGQTGVLMANTGSGLVARIAAGRRSVNTAVTSNFARIAADRGSVVTAVRGPNARIAAPADRGSVDTAVRGPNVKIAAGQRSLNTAVTSNFAMNAREAACVSTFRLSPQSELIQADPVKIVWAVDRYHLLVQFNAAGMFTEDSNSGRWAHGGMLTSEAAAWQAKADVLDNLSYDLKSADWRPLQDSYGDWIRYFTEVILCRSGIFFMLIFIAPSLR